MVLLLVLAWAAAARGQTVAEQTPQKGDSEVQIWTSAGHSAFNGVGATGLWNGGLRYGWILTNARGPGFLRGRFDHVSYERVVSGPGLLNVFHFLDEELHRPVAPEVRARMTTEDPSAVIGSAAVAGACGTCRDAVELFLSVYGAQAGNLALTVMATGGVYVGGGIVTKLLPLVATSDFLRAFSAKGRYEGLMRQIPVWLITEPKTGLIGAIHAARALVGG